METCCICLEKCLYLENISEHDINSIKYIDKLKICVPNEVWYDEFNVCNNCIEKLDTAYDFVQVCFKSEEYRKEQLRTHNEDIKEELPISFECEQCSKTFKLKRTLNLHITRIHKKGKKNSEKVKKENTHTKDFKEETDLFQVTKTDEEKIEDSILNEEKISVDENTENDEDYIDNMINDNESNYSSEEDVKPKKTPGKRGPRKRKDPLKCEYCGLLFNRSDKFTAHVRSKHTFEKPYKCDLCDAKYFSSHNLSIHKRKHTNEKPYICSSCGKSFISSNDLWQHSKIHNAVREYQCNECERCFKTHSNLRTHKLQMHLDPSLWKFVCSICGKKFPLNNNLIKHMRRHAGIKSFACHLCEKKFVEKIDLQTHLLSHSNERLFKCDLCVKEYKKKETLRRHLKVEHDIGTINIKKPEKKLPCPMCPKVFAFNNKLQRHILTHTGEKPVKCDYCDKRFRDNYDRNVHLRKEHNIDMSKNY